MLLQVVNGPEVLSKYVGQAEENIRNLFGEAEAEYKEKGDASVSYIKVARCPGGGAAACCRAMSLPLAPEWGSHSSFIGAYNVGEGRCISEFKRCQLGIACARSNVRQSA
jgi:hypothetical protein